jgi:pimeloyl-ACP methyl ester carboxylesterase
MSFLNHSSRRICSIGGWAATALAVSLLVSCMSVDVRFSSFMSPDRGPHKAVLPQGYTVRDFAIYHEGRFIGMTHARHERSQVIVIFCGGDSFHRSIEGADALEALALGADVVLFDYPGYGDSTGVLTASDVLDTALAVYDYVGELDGAEGKKLIVYGFSMGGLVAAHIAGSRYVDGVVLEATAQNADSWARSRIPWYMKPLVSARIEPALASVDALTALRHFDGRVLLLGSRADRKAPAALASRLHRQLLQAGVRAERVLFDGVTHGGIPQTAGFRPALRAFMVQVLEAPGVGEGL